MSEEWWPEEYCTRYPFRCEPPYDGPPHYPYIPTIHVVDLAAKRLRPKRRVYWHRVREAALGQWSDAGFDIEVLESLGSMAYEPGRVTLDVCDTQDGTRGQHDFGATIPDEHGFQGPWPGVDWIHIDTEWFRNYFLAHNPAALTKVLAHEFGHALGFGHNPDPEGAMSTYAVGRVSDEEKAIAREFWDVP